MNTQFIEADDTLENQQDNIEIEKLQKDAQQKREQVCHAYPMKNTQQYKDIMKEHPTTNLLI